MSRVASDRLLNSLSLRKLLAGNNHLQRVPDLLDHVPLEALDLQHNKLVELPESLFYKALKWVSLFFKAADQSIFFFISSYLQYALIAQMMWYPFL